MRTLAESAYDEIAAVLLAEAIRTPTMPPVEVDSEAALQVGDAA